MIRRRRDDEGATSAEFAIVLPFFVLLVGVAAYFGWMAFVQSEIDRAAARAARYAAVPATDGTYGFCYDQIVKQINGDLFTGSVANSDVVISDSNGALSTSTACSSAGTPKSYVLVQITHNFTNPFAVILRPFTGSDDSLQLKASGRVRVESQ